VTISSIPALRIQKELQTEILPVYLLIGADPFLKRYVIDAFIKQIDPGLRHFNVGRFAEKDLQLCLDAARTMPMMSSYRLVTLEDLAKLKEADWDELYRYLQNLNRRTIFLLIASKLHEAQINKIARHGAVISSHEPALEEARSMIERSFRKDGYQVEAEVVDELLEQAGTNVQALSQDIEKLKLFRLQEKSISVADAAALSNRVRQHQIWDLTDKIATGSQEKLLLLLHQMLEGGTAPLFLLKTIYNHFAGLLIVKEFADQADRDARRSSSREMESNIAKATGMKPYRIRRLVEQARHFQMRELRATLREIHRTDSALKGSGLPEKMLLEAMLVRIVTPEK
jgi:DNA polymerase-3 subunit delta